MINPFRSAPPDEDEQLIVAARAGSLDAFNQLVARHEQAAFGVAARLLRDAAAAEDVTQESFIAAWASVAGYRGGNVRAWILKIVTNRCYDELRRRRRRPNDSLDALPVEPEVRWSSQAAPDAPDAAALRQELLQHVERGLAHLPHDQRQAIILSDVQGHSYDEIADITGANIGTVKSRLSRARARLRDELRQTRELFDQYVRQQDRPATP